MSKWRIWKKTGVLFPFFSYKIMWSSFLQALYDAFFGTIIKFFKTLGILFVVGEGDVYVESNLWYLGWLS